MSDDPYARVRQQCVDAINGYRAKVSAPAVTRDVSKEACGDGQGKADAAIFRAHGAFGQCNEAAQCECPGYPSPIADSLSTCLQQMFDEGPGGGHYDIMTSRNYHSVSCGFFRVEGTDEVWMTMDYR